MATILNLLFPGSGLFWHKQSGAGILYASAFALLNIFRHDVGAMWAIYIYVMAQIHYFKIKGGIVRPFGRFGKITIWVITACVLALYCLIYGPSWTYMVRSNIQMFYFLL